MRVGAGRGGAKVGELTKREARIDSASRVINASRATIYPAFLSAKALVAWRRPASMAGKVFAFDPRVGGGYRMSLNYGEPDHAKPGKTAAHEDVFRGRFAELTADERIVELIDFETNDPAFGGTMRMTTTLLEVPEGTEVTITCENVPEGIGQADHLEGLAAALANLAAFVEA